MTTRANRSRITSFQEARAALVRVDCLGASYHEGLYEETDAPCCFIRHFMRLERKLDKKRPERYILHGAAPA